jgi:ribosomal protein L31E
MAGEKETKIEEKTVTETTEAPMEEAKEGVKETKKLDDVKDTPENKEAIAKDEGKTDSKPAVAKVSKKDKKVESKVELEREYIVPLKKGVLNVPHYRRAKKAVRVLKEFMVKHMGVRDRDLRKVKVDMNLNNEIWFRGIKKPMNKIKVKARKIDGIVYVELAEIPEIVGYKIAREEKKKAESAAAKVKAPKKAKEEKTEEEKTEEKEDVKAGSEMDAKMEKSAAKATQHTAQGKHAQKTMPVRKVLK